MWGVHVRGNGGSLLNFVRVGNRYTIMVQEKHSYDGRCMEQGIVLAYVGEGEGKGGEGWRGGEGHLLVMVGLTCGKMTLRTH